MITMHFSTFAKYLAATETEKLKAVSCYEDSTGGFDFWGPVRRATTAYSIGHHSQETASLLVSSQTSQNSFKSNKIALDASLDWRDKQKCFGRVAPKTTWISPNGIFGVHIEPEYSLETNTGEMLVGAYYNSKIRLTGDSAGAAVQLIQLALPFKDNSVIGVLDVFQPNARRLYKRKTKFSERVLFSVVDFLETNLKLAA